MRNTIVSILLLHFALFSFSQDMTFGILPYSRSIKKSASSVATKINDINPRFPLNWISDYISVDLTVICNGEAIKATGTRPELNQAQQNILKMADTGTDVLFNVKYYPENNLPKEIKEMSFAYRITPDIDAQFPGGTEPLQQYLKENTYDRFTEISDEKIHQARVSFVISQNGEVIATHLLQNSGITKVNDLLLSTINNMPLWIPAKNADGTVVAQEFEFIITRDLCSYQF